MRMKLPLAAAIALLAAGALGAAQDPPAQDAPAPPEPVFVRLTIYPTASLSRYDYNNDLDLYELRVYAEVRRVSQEGPPAADARVTAFAEKLEYHRRPLREEGPLRQGQAARRDRRRDRPARPPRHQGAAPSAGLACHHGSGAVRRRDRPGPRGRLAVQPFPVPRRPARLRLPDGQGVPPQGPRGGDRGPDPGGGRCRLRPSSASTPSNPGSTSATSEATGTPAARRSTSSPGPRCS